MLDFQKFFAGRDNKILFGVALAFVLIQIVFFPSTYVSIDEHSYVKNSLLLRDGSIAVEEPGYACRANSFTDQGYVSSQFIGKSIFLIPFTFFGLDAIMFSGILIHLLNFLLLILILNRFSVNKYFAFLYLFFPVFIWAARTTFAELLVLTGLLAGVYFYLSQKNKDWFFSGFFFGLAVLVRYDAIFAFISFLLPALIKNWRKGITFALGAVPLGLFILLFNSLAYGGAINTGYGSGSGILAVMFAGLFDIDHLIYGIILLVAYPLLLLSPFLQKKFDLKSEFGLLIAFYFILNAAFTTFLAFSFSIESTLIARLRYLIPLIGLLMIPYALFLSHLAKKREFSLPKNAIFIIVLVLLFGAAFLSYSHSNLINSRASALETIYANTPEGSTIIGSSDDCIFFQKNLFEDRKYYNVDLSQGLAGNPENITLDEIKTNDTYVLELFYGHRVGRASDRQNSINSERTRIVDFINENQDSLELVYENLESNTLRIYKWN